MTSLRHLRPLLPVMAFAPALVPLLSGCAPRYEDLKVFVQAHEQSVAASEYTIAPPDLLSISSPTCPELEGEMQAVGPDGKITLELLGEVKVAGLTPREVTARLKELLAVYYTEPEVSVRIAAHQSKKIFVFGEIGNPGARPFTGNDSVLSVLATCDMNRYSWGSKVKIIRPGPSPRERHEVVVDVDRMVQTGDTSGNMLLQEGDIVYVPPTPLAWVGLRIQEILFPLNSAAQAYSAPATFIGATEYYKDHNTGRTSIRLSPGHSGGYRP